MGLDDGLVLVVGPAVLADVGIEVVVPAFPALFADPARQLLGYIGPVLGPILLD